MMKDEEISVPGNVNPLEDGATFSLEHDDDQIQIDAVTKDSNVLTEGGNTSIQDEHMNGMEECVSSTEDEDNSVLEGDDSAAIFPTTDESGYVPTIADGNVLEGCAGAPKDDDNNVLEQEVSSTTLLTIDGSSYVPLKEDSSVLGECIDAPHDEDNSTLEQEVSAATPPTIDENSYVPLKEDSSVLGECISAPHDEDNSVLVGDVSNTMLPTPYESDSVATTESPVLEAVSTVTPTSPTKEEYSSAWTKNEDSNDSEGNVNAPANDDDSSPLMTVWKNENNHASEDGVSTMEGEDSNALLETVDTPMKDGDNNALVVDVNALTKGEDGLYSSLLDVEGHILDINALKEDGEPADVLMSGGGTDDSTKGSRALTMTDNGNTKDALTNKEDGSASETGSSISVEHANEDGNSLTEVENDSIQTRDEAYALEGVNSGLTEHNDNIAFPNVQSGNAWTEESRDTSTNDEDSENETVVTNGNDTFSEKDDGLRENVPTPTEHDVDDVSTKDGISILDENSSVSTNKQGSNADEKDVSALENPNVDGGVPTTHESAPTDSKVDLLKFWGAKSWKAFSEQSRDFRWSVIAAFLFLLLCIFVPIFRRSPPTFTDGNYACQSPHVIQPWQIKEFRPKWFGLFGNPGPITYKTKGRNGHRVSIVDIDRRDIEIAMRVNDRRLSHRPVVLDDTVSCGEDLVTCLKKGFGAAIISVPPGQHIIKAEVLDVNGTGKFRWGDERRKRVWWMVEECS